MSRSRSRRNRWVLEDSDPSYLDWRIERDAAPPAEVECENEELLKARMHIGLLEDRCKKLWSFRSLTAWVATAAIVFGLAGYVVGILR